jgi:hypothetical protein
VKRTIVALGLLLSASAALANEAFLLNIPLRFNASQETGEVRITLHLAAAPAGSQLVVGSTTLNLGTTQTVGGDSVAFTAGSEPSSVRIVYQPLTNFAGNFCAGAGAVEKNVNLRFVGPDITRYNMNSYLVAAPSADCSKASKRTNELPATLVPNDDGVAPALDAENGGRQPLDVVIVLDKSGSMTEFPPGAEAGPTKAELLRSAMKTFVATWSEMDVPYVDDRIGIVFFSGSASAQSQTGGDPPTAFFLRRGVYDDGADHDWFPLRANIDTLSPGGSTSVGAGINSAMQAWSGDPDHDLSMLVVTDGKQNTAPLIEPAGSGFLSLAPAAGFPAELRQRFIPIQSIGFGTPGAVDGELLTKLALETSGVSFISITVADMFDTLAMTLVSILKGNTAALALRANDVASGPSAGATRAVLVDRSVKRAVFSVQWAPPLTNALELEVLRPDGTVATPDSAATTPQSSLQSFDIDASELGTWRVRAKRVKNPTAAVSRRVPYTLQTFFVERSLDFHVSVHPKALATGDKIEVRAQISYEGKPLKSLPDGSVTVRVQRPAEGLGTVLHKLREPGSGPAAVSGDAVSALHRKVARLPRAVLKRLVPADAKNLALRHVGNGVYSGTFDDTSVPGVYAFETRLEWDDPRTGALRREERLETTVRVRPDPFLTTVELSPNLRGVVSIRVTPIDRFGNFLGPGHASRIQAKLRSVGRLEPVPTDKNETGTYVFTVRGVPAGETPQLDITVDDIPLRVGKF